MTARRFASFLMTTSSLLMPSDDSLDCKDGVCSIKPKGKDLTSQIVDEWKISGGQTNDTSINDGKEEKINAIVNLGWEKVEATKALEKFKYNIDEAIAYLEEIQENDEKTVEKTKELCKLGDWSEESARAALLESKNNVTLANEMLVREESIVVNEFETAVKGMLENGWDEIVARQALMAQWSLDQRKARGLNNTVDAEVLKSIKPSLKQSNTTEAASSGKTKPKAAAGGGSGNEPTPAKKEDCVFEINASNFQKLVLESPVPVLVDVYADWCGPCKQLGPILENAAMKSGGMFRLAKVNSDKERALSELLEVSGLPTVYAVNKGKIVDKFVGMLPQDQLQQFLVRVITGYGAKVQQENNDDQTLGGLTFKVNNYAGLAALDFKKREKIRTLVDEAILGLDGGYNAESATYSAGVKTALQYINNAAKDIHNKTFRSINTTSSVFIERIGSNACALKLLDIAGFKADATGTSLQLVHSNSAVLTLASQRVTETVQKQKFAKIKEVKVELGSNKSLRRKGNAEKSAQKASVEESDSDEEEDEPVKKVVETVKVSIKLLDNKSVGRSYKDLSTPLADVLDDLLDGKQWDYIEIRQPLPRRQIKRESAELSKSLQSIAGDSENIAIALINEDSVVTTKSSLKKAKSAASNKVEKKDKPRKKKGTHTLLSSGILSTKKKKNNEYFGGDSTLTLAGDEDEDDDANSSADAATKPEKEVEKEEEKEDEEKEDEEKEDEEKEDEEDDDQ